MNISMAADEFNQSGITSHPISILIVVPSLMRAGAETQAVDLANGLADRGHLVHLCSFESQLDQRNRVSDKVRFHHIRRRSKYDLSLISRISALIEREKIDVVQGVLQFATLIAWLAAMRSASSPPVVAAVHTTINRGLKQELQDRILYRRMLRRLPAIVFVCEHQRTHWIKKYPDLTQSSVVVHNGIAPERFQYSDFAESGRNLRANLHIPAEAFLFTCVAGFRPEKGHRILIDAFARIQSDAYLAFAGDGDLRREMEEYAESTGLKNRMRFLGMIPDTRPIIAASNATVLASTAVETFSMAMLESMALGVPMIAPQIGGLSEAIVPNDTGLLFPIGDVSALAGSMQSMLDSPSEAKKMGHSAELLVSKVFTLRKMVMSSEKVFRNALD